MRVKRDASGNFTVGGISAVGSILASSGIEAFGSTGVWGGGSGSNSTGVFGNGSVGVWGEGGGMGVLGAADQGIGLYARVNSSISGTFGVAIIGENFGHAGINGFGPDGTDGISHNAGGSGIAGLNDAGGTGVFGQVTNGGTAGDFFGDVAINGHLSKSSGSFKIDHPLDPANKYLYHSFVESPDMMNIYNGNVITDANGSAVVQLPEWFEALNRDFRGHRRDRDCQPPLHHQNRQAERKSLVAGDGHSSGCLGECAPHSRGASQVSRGTWILFAPRTVRCTNRKSCDGAATSHGW